MLRSVEELRGYTPVATDGEIGSVSDCYFDDARWTVRYLVVDTGGWLAGRRVLISPYAIGVVDQRDQRLALTLPRALIRDSPDIDTDKPISRQREAEYYQYYGWAPYWGGTGLWGAYPYPQAVLATPPPTMGSPDDRPSAGLVAEDGDPHLRSMAEVGGYDIAALDGEIGQVRDFIVDDRDWTIRYLVADTGNWLLPGRELLIAPEQIAQVSWAERRVLLDAPQAAIATSPGRESVAEINGDEEVGLLGRAERPRYVS